MKKDQSNLRRFMMLVLLVTSGLIIQLYFSANVKMLSSEKNRLETELLHLKDRMEDRVVEVQKLSSKERISNLAHTKIGMIKAPKPFEKIYLNHLRTKKIVQLVEKKYD